ncbi:MAG: hypothetical protein IKO56_03820 [Alphaproteobacteria bacterium]|nr:hypothetical protein [Alphaproteobacteria bacterium]
MMIQDEMYKAIEKEINQTIESDSGKIIVDYNKAKKVAKMLTELSMDKADAESLTNQYIAGIKNICNNI